MQLGRRLMLLCLLTVSFGDLRNKSMVIISYFTKRMSFWQKKNNMKYIKLVCVLRE